MKPRICPKCKTYLSIDQKTWYCTECDHEEGIQTTYKGSLDENE